MIGLEHLELALRVALAVTFAASAFGKARDRRAFAAAVEDFAIVPRQWSSATAVAVIASEMTVVVALALGGPVLVVGFLGAGALLLAFTYALTVALRHHDVVACNCFGTATARLSRLDLARNALLLSASVAGAATASGSPGRADGPTTVVIVLAGVGAAMVVANLADVVRTLIHPFRTPGSA